MRTSRDEEPQYRTKTYPMLRSHNYQYQMIQRFGLRELEAIHIVLKKKHIHQLQKFLIIISKQFMKHFINHDNI